MTHTIEQIKNLQISDATATLIACRCTLDQLYSKIADALSSIYSDHQVENTMETQCSELFNALEDKINDFIINSISDNICTTDIKEI